MLVCIYIHLKPVWLILKSIPLNTIFVAFDLKDKTAYDEKNKSFIVTITRVKFRFEAKVKQFHLDFYFTSEPEHKEHPSSPSVPTSEFAAASSTLDGDSVDSADDEDSGDDQDDTIHGAIDLIESEHGESDQVVVDEAAMTSVIGDNDVTGLETEHDAIYDPTQTTALDQSVLVHGRDVPYTYDEWLREREAGRIPRSPRTPKPERQATAVLETSSAGNVQVANTQPAATALTGQPAAQAPTVHPT